MLTTDDVDPQDLRMGFHPDKHNEAPDKALVDEGPYLTAGLKPATICIRTGCQNARLWRGMCARCAGYELMRVGAGYATWAALESVSRALPDDRPAPVAVLRAAKPYCCYLSQCNGALYRDGLCLWHFEHAQASVAPTWHRRHEDFICPACHAEKGMFTDADYAEMAPVADVPADTICIGCLRTPDEVNQNSETDLAPNEVNP